MTGATPLISTAEARNAPKIALLHPALQDRAKRFLAAMEAQGIAVIITQGLRSYEEQAKLYAQGRTSPGPRVTKAKPGQSWHQFALAIDVAPVEQGASGLVPDWNIAHPSWKAILATALGFELAEGALWTTIQDNPHLQLKEIPASPTQEVEDLYLAQGLPAVWAWVDKIIGLG